MEITFDINKEAVYTEIAQTTSYVGAKTEDDPTSYERIFTTDEDQSQLERYFDESCSTFTGTVRRFVRHERDIKEEGSGKIVGRQFDLEFSELFDTSLIPGMRRDLQSFFVMSITSKWFSITNKRDYQEYATVADKHLEDFQRKACYKRAPERPSYK